MSTFATRERERIHPRQDALIIVDLQPDFMPGGALAVPEGDQIVSPIAALAARFATVVATQDFHPPGHVSFASRHGQGPFVSVPLYGGEQALWPEHCVQGTPGAELHPGLPREPLTLILRKGTDRDVDSYSAFRENLGPDGQRRTTGLGALLRARGVRRVFVCGLARDYCVRWTAADAVAEGLRTVVLDDLCRAVFPERDAETRLLLASSGVQCASSKDLGDPGDLPGELPEEMPEAGCGPV